MPSHTEDERRRRRAATINRNRSTGNPYDALADAAERSIFGQGGFQGAGERSVAGNVLLRGAQELVELNPRLYSAYQGSELARGVMRGSPFEPRFNPNLSRSVVGQGGDRFVPNYEMTSRSGGVGGLLSIGLGWLARLLGPVAAGGLLLGGSTPGQGSFPARATESAENPRRLFPSPYQFSDQMLDQFSWMQRGRG